MKVVVISAFLVSFGFVLTCVQAYSMPDCSQGCDPKYCPEVPECPCGTYLDYCECCAFCLKCPGEECSLVAMEQCANNTTCQAPPGASFMQRINGPGKCV